MSDRMNATAPFKPNGAGSAALLAAGVGSFFIAFFAILADKATAFRNAMTFYTPTGPLSGVTTSAIAVWLIVWAVLQIRWRNRTVSARWTNSIALALLLLSLLLTFPPIADLF